MTTPQTTPTARHEPVRSMAEKAAGKLEALAALLAVCHRRAGAFEDLSESETVALMALGFDLAHEARELTLNIMTADQARGAKR